MSDKKATKRKPTKLTKEAQELKRLAEALGAVQHNPVNWAGIFRYVAPILARVAARYAVKYLAKKWNKRATPAFSQETAEKVADEMAELISRLRLR